VTGRGKVLVVFDLQVKANEIGYVKLVINYDLPRSVEGYAQRFVFLLFSLLSSSSFSLEARSSKLTISSRLARVAKTESHQPCPEEVAQELLSTSSKPTVETSRC